MKASLMKTKHSPHKITTVSDQIKLFIFLWLLWLNHYWLLFELQYDVYLKEQL